MSSPQTPLNQDQVDFVGLSRRVRQRFLQFCLVVVLVVGGAVAYTFFVPPVYQAKATVILPAQSVPTPALGGLASTLGLQLGNSEQDSLMMIKAILESRRVAVEVAKQVGVDPDKLEMDVREDRFANTLSLRVRDGDSERALRLSSLYIESLRAANKSLRLPTRSVAIAELESLLDSRQQQLMESEALLEDFLRGSQTAPFQMGLGGFSPNLSYKDQLNALRFEYEQLTAQLEDIDRRTSASARLLPDDLPPVMKWAEELTRMEAELTAKRATLAPGSTELRQMEQQYADAQQSLKRDVDNYLESIRERVAESTADIETQRVGIEEKISSLEVLAEVAPSEMTAYARLRRDTEILNSIVQQVRLELEQARLDRTNDPNRWEVLDEPYLEPKPINKRYGRNGAVALLLGVVLGAVIAGRQR